MVATKKQQTKQLILDTAWQLFLHHGFDNTSTRAIASEANIAVGTVFSHFENKPALLYELMQEKTRDVLTATTQADEATQPKLKLRHYTLALYSFYLAHLPLSKAFLQYLLFHPASYHDYRSTLINKLLHHAPHYDQAKLNAMLDCYFMTLVEGINTPQINVNELVRSLSAKLTLL